VAKQKKVSGINPLKEDLKTGHIGRLYIFHGEEKYLLEHYLGLLKSRLVSPETEQFNYIVFDGREMSLEELADAVEALPVFSDRKLIAVKDFDLYGAGEAEREVLHDLISDIPDSTCLVFVYDTLEYKADLRKKIRKAVLDAGKIIEFGVQETSDLVAWLKRRFRALEKTIDTPEAEYMLFICGKLMQPLTLEVEKVAAYSKSERISRSDIDAVCYPVIEAVMYNMTDAVAEQRYGDAIKILKDLLAMKSEPIILLAALGKQLRNLLYTRILMDSGDPGKFLREKLGITYPFVIRKMIGNARSFSEEWLTNAVQLCAEADLRMKTTADDNGEILELLILRLGDRGTV
jgi:DNA polymerase-3 subunit delta